MGGFTLIAISRQGSNTLLSALCFSITGGHATEHIFSSIWGVSPKEETSGHFVFFDTVGVPFFKCGILDFCCSQWVPIKFQWVCQHVPRVLTPTCSNSTSLLIHNFCPLLLSWTYLDWQTLGNVSVFWVNLCRNQRFRAFLWSKRGSSAKNKIKSELGRHIQLTNMDHTNTT